MKKQSTIKDIYFGYGQLLISDGCRIPVSYNVVVRKNLEIKIKFIFSEINYPALFNLFNGGLEVLKLDNGKLIAVRGIANGYNDSEKSLCTEGREIIYM